MVCYFAQSEQSQKGLRSLCLALRFAICSLVYMVIPLHSLNQLGSPQSDVGG